MNQPSARSLSQRTLDAVHRLENDIDLWVATADPSSGSPYMVPLSFHWDGSVIRIATTAASPTGRNLAATGQVRLGIGETRDVVLVEGEVTRSYPAVEIADQPGDAFAARAGFDPRQSRSSMLFFDIRPRRIQAWREENELSSRTIMRDGAWLDAVSSAR